MIAEQHHIDTIKGLFEKMETREEFLELLNYTKPLVIGENAVPFQLKQITYYAFSKSGRTRYTEFHIRKKRGGYRTIHAPVSGLKTIQRVLAFVLQCVFEPHKAATGFVHGKSIVDNARPHVAANYVYNLDLKDFFPSIDQARVWKCLQLKPFNLVDNVQSTTKSVSNTGVRRFTTTEGEHIYYKINGGHLTLVIDKQGNFKRYRDRLSKHTPQPENLLDFNGHKAYQKIVNSIVLEDAKKYILSEENLTSQRTLLPSRQKLAAIIAGLCCTEMEVERLDKTNQWVKGKRNVLPQGAPTSPVLTNVVCQRLDFILAGVAKRFGLKYTRYADDITFSSMHNVYQPGSDFLKELHRVIAEQGFHIKESKTRLQKDGYRQEVTGLLVNKDVNVQKRYIKQLRMWLYYWERYGYERAYELFLHQYLSDKGHAKAGKPDMVNVIRGKLEYLRMVKGGESSLFEKLQTRFRNCANLITDSRKNPKFNKNTGSPQENSAVLDMIFECGLDEAMKRL